MNDRMPEKLSYEESKSLARDGDPAVRKALARHPDTKPEVLYYLAEDADAGVRREIAANAQTPVQADLLLAGDAEEEIRAVLAEKIGRLTPGLTESDRAPVADFMLQTLETLARDQVVRVRAILAEALKDVADAPASVILELAGDAELKVSGPVLRFSPVLTDADLISIIQAGAAQGQLSAIAGRAGVPASVSDALVACGDDRTVATLLTNGSAQIREETLDALVDQAPDRPGWHAPLVDRPLLSLRAARHLAGFIAADLMARLQARTDLAPETLDAITQAVAKRMEEEDRGTDGGGPDLVDPDWAQEDVSEEDMIALHSAGKLTESALSGALEQGRKRYVEAALSAMATIPRAAVAKIIARRSPKAVVALAWKAGLSPAISGGLQIQLAGIPPDKVLLADGAEEWPMSDEDMDWQLEFFLSG